MKSTVKSIAVAMFCVTPLLSATTIAATDSEQFGRCKRAAQSQYGESSKVKLVRISRYRGLVTVKLRVQSDSEKEGARFVSLCTIDKAGTLEIAARE